MESRVPAMVASHPPVLSLCRFSMSHPSTRPSWSIAHNGEVRAFSARHDAVVYAAKLAVRLDRIGGSASLGLDGEDGKWTLFAPSPTKSRPP